MPHPFPLDHVPFGAADVESARDAWSALGFVASDLGECRWSLGETESSARSVCIVFRSEYLDFIELTDPRWLEFTKSAPAYARGFAPNGIVLSAESPDAERERLGEAGVDASEPYDITRTLPGGAAIHYRIASVDGRTADLPFSFLSDDAPATLRRSAWLAHPNGVEAIAGIVLRVPDAAAARADADRLLGPGRVAGNDIQLGRAACRLVEAPGERTSLHALEFATVDLERATRVLAACGIPFARSAERIEVESNEGFGCGVAFVPAHADPS